MSTATLGQALDLQCHQLREVLADRTRADEVVRCPGTRHIQHKSNDERGSPDSPSTKRRYCSLWVAVAVRDIRSWKLPI